MRSAALVLITGLAIGLGISLPGAVAQDEGKTTAEPLPNKVDTDLIWNFYWHGKKQRGKFIEFLEPDEGRGRSLVITQIDLRVTRSTRLQVVEHRKGKQKLTGKQIWKKTVRRGDGFSLGFPDSTSQWIMTGYAGFTGLKFDPHTRPALEVTLGGGEMYVYAEGYWSRP